MKKQDYTASIIGNATAEEAFNSIKNVSKWWTEDLEGSSQKLNDEFTVRFGETWISIKITELVHNKKIAWHVTDCYKHWLKDKKEWKDTKMTWDISAEKTGTKISFTHFGLVPGVECYGVCEKAWDHYVKESLFKLLNEGKGTPELKTKNQLSK